MLRFEATKLILRHAGNSPIVGNLGPTSDELRHAGHRDRNFYTYGSMGLCSSIALGMALSTTERVISLDGDGSLLDHSMIVYGAGMGDSNSHASKNLPILLAGGGVGSGGRHTMYPEDTPLANLHLSLLDKMGVPIDTLGHSTGRLPLEPLSVG